mgnify:CR=1 FL=1|jgi:DNA-binding protein Fis
MFQSDVENKSLQNEIHTVVTHYLQEAGKNCQNLQEIFLEQVEIPMLEAVMRHCKYNQVRAAKLLGISRGTLRKKLRQYFDDKYAGTREMQD